jgi:hypothetical protein
MADSDRSVRVVAPLRYRFGAWNHRTRAEGPGSDWYEGGVPDYGTMTMRAGPAVVGSYGLWVAR